MKIYIYGAGVPALVVQRARMAGLGGTEWQVEAPSPAFA